MNKELKFIIYLAVANIIFGFGIYYKLKAADDLIPQRFPLFTNANQIYTDYARGLTTLINCNYFIKTYPKYRKALISHKEVYFAYSEAPTLKGNYAVTDASQNTIFLGPEFFKVKDANYREGIIGHELLHIVGMPLHKSNNMTPAETIHDAIYTVEHWCFHGDHPWTGVD